MLERVNDDDYRMLADAVTIATGYTAILRHGLQNPAIPRDILLEYADGVAEQLAIVDRWIPPPSRPNGPP
jgi:hypothetical protein